MVVGTALMEGVEGERGGVVTTVALLFPGLGWPLKEGWN